MNRKARPRKRLPRARGQTAPGPSVHVDAGRRASAHVCERHRVRSDVAVLPRRRRSPGPRSRSCRAFAPPPPSPSRAGPGARPGPCGPFPMRGPRSRDGPSNQAEGGCGRRTSPHGVKAPVPREGANAVPARGCLEAGRVVWHPHAAACGDCCKSAKKHCTLQAFLFPGRRSRPRLADLSNQALRVPPCRPGRCGPDRHPIGRRPGRAASTSLEQPHFSVPRAPGSVFSQKK